MKAGRLPCTTPGTRPGRMLALGRRVLDAHDPGSSLGNVW
jgi:hypothetical protein